MAERADFIYSQAGNSLWQNLAVNSKKIPGHMSWMENGDSCSVLVALINHTQRKRTLFNEVGRHEAKHSNRPVIKEATICSHKLDLSF